MVLTMAHLRASPVAACAGYHAIIASIICRTAVTAVTAASQLGLTWSLVLVVVVGWVSRGVGCHAMSKVVELSCDIDCVISLWSWILLWIYPHFVEISTFRGYYPHFCVYPYFVDIIRISWKYPCYVDIICILWEYPRFVVILRISCVYPYSVDIIRIFW